jgi:MarR family transcriptional regulator, organic hydroperoxide resistance regulator
MRSLADEWGCDASNATWIIDRLEQRSLVERRAHPEDRRARLVVVTAAGKKIWKRVLHRMWSLPPELLELSRVDLEQLQKALAKLPQVNEPGS